MGSFSFVLQPALSITSGGGTVTIQWPANATVFTLAQNTHLSRGSRSDVRAIKRQCSEVRHLLPFSV